MVKLTKLNPTELKISSLVPMLLNYVFYFFDMIRDLKLIRLGNNCVT